MRLTRVYIYNVYLEVKIGFFDVAVIWNLCDMHFIFLYFYVVSYLQGNILFNDKDIANSNVLQDAE